MKTSKKVVIETRTGFFKEPAKEHFDARRKAIIGYIDCPQDMATPFDSPEQARAAVKKYRIFDDVAGLVPVK